MLTYEEAAKLWSYNSVTGLITRISDGHVYRPKKYVRVRYKGYSIAGHRLAWLLHYGIWPKDQIDHVNRKENDNRISNLREANDTQNKFNRGTRKDNVSGKKG